MSDRVDHGTNTVSAKELIGFARELIAADRDIDTTTTAAAAARGVRSGIMKRIKKAGTDMDAFEDLRRLMKVDDDEERNRRVENMHVYAGYLNVTLYRAPTEARPQGSMFDTETQAAAGGLQDARDYTDGWNSAMQGGDYEENPKIAGSSAHQQWAKGFKDWEFENAGKPAPAKVANTAPRGKANGGQAPKPAKVAAPKKPRAKKAGAAASPFN